jgi:hypothetical protein
VVSIPPEKRLVWIGLLFAAAALLLVLQWPPTASRDLRWMGLLLGSAVCIVAYEHRLRQMNRGSALLRWTGVAIGVAAALLVVLGAD